ncbi:uncharacterized protein SCHCODRAFT_02235257 [Schizophyllum commune H4-8]|uniref:uncharacterized protein n=1 Tax=Schizophyllum commune (strain H4-8 / FGSC 9210) TaxID=578458 RepID=UPI00215EF5DF|nr:uncharacterized protein SCHCODRAFT_02235257 [Schizophyllum commune H4-8]KAI5895583.1 hypothetical protein SCHCODRAFT_02235257 [Schizophyllum commune H4-8]
MSSEGERNGLPRPSLSYISHVPRPFILAPHPSHPPFFISLVSLFRSSGPPRLVRSAPPRPFASTPRQPHSMSSYPTPYRYEKAYDDGKSPSKEAATPMTTSTSIHFPRHPFDRAPIVGAYRYARRVLNENLYTHRTRALLWRTLWAGIQVSTILVALALATPPLALRTPAALSVLAWLVRTLLWCALKWWSWMRLCVFQSQHPPQQRAILTRNPLSRRDRVPDHSLAVTWRPFVIVYERPEDDVRSARMNSAMDVITGIWIGWAAALVNCLPGLCAPQTLLWWLHIALYAPHVLAYNVILAT